MNATGSLVLVVTLALAFAMMRAAGMLGPAGSRWLLPLGFVFMAFTPWVLLSSEGRRHIGLAKSVSARYFAYGITSGVLAALACFVIGLALFGTAPGNWFISIASNYRKIVDTTSFTTTKLHLVFTVPAMLFSPIGEEIFFRGVLQRTLEQRLSAKVSTTIECAAFGLVHLCHHGLFLGISGITFLPLSGALWTILMFLVGWMFASIRKRSESLFPAIASHVSFNVAMNVVIFSFLWESLA